MLRRMLTCLFKSFRSLSCSHWRPDMLPRTTHTQAASRLSNKPLSSANVEDNQFIEEPLEVSMDEGHGFLKIEFGDTMGPDHRYRIVRKLGWGMSSSVWMAFDEQYVFIHSYPDAVVTSFVGIRDTLRSKL
jgi:hypothetical protein